ncbi:MAG: DUF502 domain-containing protein [Planctomycetota bacterium]|nr:DUF502 domain-containing protein [Planctomycetota bacterium]
MFIALPLAITVAVLVWLWQQLDGPLSFVFGFTTAAGGMSERLNRWLQGTPHAADLMVPLLGLCILIVAVLVLGILIRSILGQFLLSIFERIVASVPLVGVLYTSIKQLGEAFVSDEGASKFQSAVLVQFPMEGSWVIGFVTGSAYAPLAKAMTDPLKEAAEEKGEKLPEILTVFVPTTPLPTQGFTLVLPRSETRALDVTVEEAIKLVISGGIISAPGNSHRRTAPSLDLEPKKKVK